MSTLPMERPARLSISVRWDGTTESSCTLLGCSMSTLVTPDDLSLLGHEEYPWLTLITCRGYDEAGNSYAYRVGVRAVLVDVVPEDYDSRVQ